MKKLCEICNKEIVYDPKSADPNMALAKFFPLPSHVKCIEAEIEKSRQPIQTDKKETHE